MDLHGIDGRGMDLLGIGYIVAHGLGYNLVFSGGWPTFVPR